MTKKYGERGLDARIAYVNNVNGKYAVEEKSSSQAIYFTSLKAARDLVSNNEMRYKFVRDMTFAKPKVAPTQARPPAAPAAKVYVPKGGGKKPTPPKAPSWPFPAAKSVHTVIVNGVTIEFTDEVSINVVSPYRVKVSKT